MTTTPILPTLIPRHKAFSPPKKAVGLDAGYFTVPITESLARREVISVFDYRRPTKIKSRKADYLTHLSSYDRKRQCS